MSEEHSKQGQSDLHRTLPAQPEMPPHVAHPSWQRVSCQRPHAPALSGNSRAGALDPTLHHILLKSEPSWWRKMELGPMALIFGQQIVKDR